MSSSAPIPTVEQVYQALAQVTPWQELLLYRVLFAEFYRPANQAEWEMTLRLAHPSCGVLECLEHSGKYRLTTLGLYVVKALSARRG